MQIQDIIKFLRQSVLVQDPDVATVDEDFLSMKDEDFIPLLQIALSKVDPSDDLFSLSEENLYGNKNWRELDSLRNEGYDIAFLKATMNDKEHGLAFFLRG